MRDLTNLTRYSANGPRRRQAGVGATHGQQLCGIVGPLLVKREDGTSVWPLR